MAGRAVRLVGILGVAACAHAPPVLPTPEEPRPPQAQERVEVPQLPTVTVAPKPGRTYAVIRVAPDARSPILARVAVGTELKWFTRDGEWYQVQVPTTGQLGWIRQVYLR